MLARVLTLLLLHAADGLVVADGGLARLHAVRLAPTASTSVLCCAPEGSIQEQLKARMKARRVRT